MIKECDPKTLDEYNLSARSNQEFAGAGADTIAIFPCPGCCAKHWAEFRIVAMADLKESKPTKCKTCGRTFFFRITRVMGQTTMKLCQSGGDDVPDYLPVMYRV